MATESWTATTPSPNRCASERAISVPRSLPSAPTISMVTGCPDWMAMENPAGMMNAALTSPASTAVRAADSVATSVTSATSASTSEPITSCRSTRARSPPSRSATT